MKIYVVGSSKNKFLPLDNIREKFLIDEKHEGINIDFLNPWFCEITGLYYLINNTKDEVIGLEHYRNYFYDRNLLCEKEINKLLIDNDIICSSADTPLPLKTELHILTHGFDKPFMDMLKIKDENFYNFLTTYLDQKRFYWCNCFIGKRPVIEKWYNYFFNIIIEFEKTYTLQKSPVRREGFFAEYLFGAWLEYNNYKIVHSNMTKFNKDLSGVERFAKL